MTLTVHKSQVHCSGIMQRWACSSLNPLLCLQRQVAKLVSTLFYYWPLLRNNNMATNLQRFTSSWGSSVLPNVPVADAHDHNPLYAAENASTNFRRAATSARDLVAFRTAATVLTWIRSNVTKKWKKWTPRRKWTKPWKTLLNTRKTWTAWFHASAGPTLLDITENSAISSSIRWHHISKVNALIFLSCISHIVNFCKSKKTASPKVRNTTLFWTWKYFWHVFCISQLLG